MITDHPKIVPGVQADSSVAAPDLRFSAGGRLSSVVGRLSGSHTRPRCWDDRCVIAGRPGTVPIPETLWPMLSGMRAQVVWRNELGGLTIEATGAVGRRFIKWAPAGSGLNLAAEAPRLRWAGAYTPVPRVLGGGTDHSGEWLITAAVAGSSAVAPRWKAAPETAVCAIGVGLRGLHNALPVASCPFSWSAEDRVADAMRRARLRTLSPKSWHPEHAGLSVDEALHAVSQSPPTDQLVVCHGDACAPNTMLADDGSPAGHVDLGDLGVADRWADLAVATWSIDWNYGPGWQRQLLDAYGIDPDPDRLAYYRLLWDLGP